MESYKEIPNWVFFEEKHKLEMFNDLGLLDQNELAVCFAMTEFADKYQSAYLPLQSLYKYIYEYGLKNNLNALKNETNIVSLLKKSYLTLHRKNYCSADRKDNNIVGLILTNPMDMNPEQIQSIYQKLKKDFMMMDGDYSIPFPTADIVPQAALSSKALNVIAVSDLNDQKIADCEKTAKITKVNMSSNGAILVPSDELGRLYDRSFSKLKFSLARSKDLSTLIVMKMKKQYPNMSNINTSEDFFRYDRDSQFWAVLASEILNYAENNEKEKAISQSAEIIKHVSIINSEQQQKKTHDEKSLDIIMKILQNYQVSFTKGQLLQLREKHNYLKLYTERDYINIVADFINTFTVQKDAHTPPEVIPVRYGGETHYIYREHFFKIFMEKIDSLSYELRKFFADKFSDNASEFAKNPVVRDPEIFSQYINTYLDKHPDLSSIFENPQLLHNLLIFEGSKDNNIAKLMDRFFYPQIDRNDVPQLRTFAEILLIDREKLLRDAHIRVPFGSTGKISLIMKIINWFRGFGRNIGKAVDSQLEQKKNAPKISDLLQAGKDSRDTPSVKDKPRETESPQKKVEDKKRQMEKQLSFKKQLNGLQKEVIGDKDRHEMMDYYNNRWNRTINKTAKEDNLKLVHGRIHHRIKFLNMPPMEQIKKEAMDMIRTDDTLQKIYDMESLKNYILLYIIEYYIQREEKQK